MSNDKLRAAFGDDEVNSTARETAASFAGSADSIAPQTRAEARATQTPNKWIPSPAARLWIFRCIAAVGPLVTFYGLATAEEVALWLGLGAMILGTPAASLAAVNVPR